MPSGKKAAALAALGGDEEEEEEEEDEALPVRFVAWGRCVSSGGGCVIHEAWNGAGLQVNEALSYTFFL